MSGRVRRANGTTIEPLTRAEIERRIQDVITEVSASAEQEIGGGTSAEGFRWITPADLVRRMRPYLSVN